MAGPVSQGLVLWAEDSLWEAAEALTSVVAPCGASLGTLLVLSELTLADR